MALIVAAVWKEVDRVPNDDDGWSLSAPPPPATMLGLVECWNDILIEIVKIPSREI